MYAIYLYSHRFAKEDCMANTKDNSKEKFHWAALGVSKTFSGHGELLLQLKECFGSIRDFYGASERALRASGVLAPRAVERFLQMRDRDLPARLEESCSRLGIGWDDALLISAHGRACNYRAKIRKNPKG